MASIKASVGILSFGDMGAGIARMLTANGFKVWTNVSDRSKATRDRATAAQVQLASSDVQLCNNCAYILSIVPPRDALETAERIVAAAQDPSASTNSNNLCYVDMNAISPRSAREIASRFSQKAPQLRFIDGCIIGSPPKLQPDKTWTKPNMILSGPWQLRDSGEEGERLAETLNARHQDGKIGSASTLKVCFASLTKGLTALAIQSFTVAHEAGVAKELQEQLKQISPNIGEVVNRGLPSMPPKAYRWVKEMEEIADTFEVDGGFSEDESMFRAIAKTYALVANDTELGKEQTDSRVQGKTAEDVGRLMSEGIRRRKEKLE